jgi:hypothetical protein
VFPTDRLRSDYNKVESESNIGYFILRSILVYRLCTVYLVPSLYVKKKEGILTFPCKTDAILFNLDLETGLLWRCSLSLSREEAEGC